MSIFNSHCTPMKYFWILPITLSLTVLSCGKKKPDSKLDSKDTLTVEEMEGELKKLEEESAQLNEELDSINTEIDKPE